MPKRTIMTENGPLEVEEISENDIRTFRRAAGTLRNLIARIRQYNPEANLYQQEDTLCLMAGPVHTGHWGSSHQEHVVESVFIPGSDGGAW